MEYNRLNKKYQTGETLAVLIEQDSSLLDKENIINVLRVQEKIKEIDGVAQIQSFIPSEIQAMGNIIPVNIDFVDPDTIRIITGMPVLFDEMNKLVDQSQIQSLGLVLANAFGLAIGLSVLFFSPLRVHLQAASMMWVAMVLSSMAALLLIPIFYSFSRSR